MYLYLKFEGRVRIVSNIRIDDDCAPWVEGDRLSDSPSLGEFSSKSSIDAIAWFKTMAMQSVFVDCTVRDVRWSPRQVAIRDSPPPSPVKLRKPVLGGLSKSDSTVSITFNPPSSRPLFSDHPGVADFNPNMDELFESAEELCLNWENLAQDTTKLNKEVGKILHCYILPYVTFQKDDLAVLEECLRLVSYKQKDAENQIMDKENNVSIVDKFLNKKKEALMAIEQLTTQAYLEVCDIEFVNQFYLHVTREIQIKNQKLEILQLKINDLKTRMANKEDDSELPNMLSKLKADRDNIHGSIEKLIIVREAIRNFLYRPFIPKKKKRWRNSRKLVLEKEDIVLMQSFQEAHKRLIEDKDVLKHLCYRKVHIAAIREAIESTIQLLRRDGTPEPLGDLSEFSVHENTTPLERSQSVSREKHRRQWKSMQQSVNGWMERDSAVHRAHSNGCQLICDLANGMLSDLRIASMGLESSEVKDGDSEDDPKLRPGMDELDAVELFSITSQSGGASVGTVLAVDHGSPVNDYEDLSSKRAPMVQVIRDQLLTHLQEMSERIVKQIDLEFQPGNRHLNRAWVCYCSHFWKEVKDAVESVYAHYHAPEAKQVHRRVVAMALADIMDSRMFETIFNPTSQTNSTADDEDLSGFGAAAAPHSPRSQDTVSAVSLDLQRCSVTDLYAKANRDGDRLVQQMLHIESIRCSVGSVGSDSSYDGGESDRGDVETVGSSVQHNSGTGNNNHKTSVTTTSDVSKDLGKGDSVENSKSVRPKLETGGRPGSSSSESGASVHSDDLFSDDGLDRKEKLLRPDSLASDKSKSSDKSNSSDKTIRSSQTVASVLSLFDAIVQPYHAKVREVLKAPDIMEKLKCVWQSVDFLSQKAGELCKQRGMDQLLPLSIFATASFPEDLFVDYYIQLLILQDLKPSFALHSMYDFSLTSAFATYMYLFEKRFSEADASVGLSHTSR